MTYRLIQLGLFCAFIFFVLFVNYHIARIVGGYCIDGINFISGRDDFYVLGNKGVAIGMYISFGAIPANFFIVSLLSIATYFLNKRIYLSYSIAVAGFVIYCIFFPYFKLYFLIVYCIAFCLALCEIKILYALQDYIKIKRNK